MMSSRTTVRAEAGARTRSRASSAEATARASCPRARRCRNDDAGQAAVRPPRRGPAPSQSSVGRAPSGWWDWPRWDCRGQLRPMMPTPEIAAILLRPERGFERDGPGWRRPSQALGQLLAEAQAGQCDARSPPPRSGRERSRLGRRRLRSRVVPSSDRAWLPLVVSMTQHRSRAKRPGSFGEPESLKHRLNDAGGRGPGASGPLPARYGRS